MAEAAQAAGEVREAGAAGAAAQSKSRLATITTGVLAATALVTAGINFSDELAKAGQRVHNWFYGSGNGSANTQAPSSTPANQPEIKASADDQKLKTQRPEVLPVAEEKDRNGVTIPQGPGGTRQRYVSSLTLPNGDTFSSNSSLPVRTIVHEDAAGNRTITQEPVPYTACRDGTQVPVGSPCPPSQVQYMECPGGVRVVPGGACPALMLAPSVVFFGFDEDTLTDQARQTLDSVAENYVVAGRPQVVVAGHTDLKGPATYNARLAERRAGEVRRYLVGRGVPASDIKTQAFGETRPRIETADDVREPENRRVEITFGPTGPW